METVFIKLLNMSIIASWLIIAVIILRLVLKKAPKWITCVLWAFVAVRLICPISIESIMSLIPNAEVIQEDIIYSENPSITTGVAFVNNAVNPMIQDTFSPKTEESLKSNPLQMWTSIAAIIWLIGVIGILSYALISYRRLRRKVSTAVRLEGNLWQSEYVSSPFILGIIRPRIYLPFQMKEKQRNYVVAHEKSHLARKDHWWKPLGFVLLAVYWFNPLCWAAYWLLCKDIELACDEKVIKDFDLHNKKMYSETLVFCSVSRRSITACPLAFGETDVKNRIRNVLNYKKPAFWMILLAALVCIVIAVCFLTNPKAEEDIKVVSKDATYYVVETAYDSPSYSFTYVPTGYQITEENILLSQGEITGNGEGWTKLGSLSPIELTTENFDDYFTGNNSLNDGGGWLTNKNAESIREENESAWKLSYEYVKGDSSKKILYYVLKQKSGETYLAYGYDYAAKDDSFRWLFELSEKLYVEKVTEGYTLEDALKDDLVIIADGDVMNGQEKWADFVETTFKGEPANIKVVRYYTLGDKSHYDETYYESIKDEYPKLFILYLSYDGDQYTVAHYEDEQLYAKSYKYLMRYEGEAIPTATYESYVRYVLVNDNTLTWDDIWRGLISSQIDAAVEHTSVYEDLEYKE